MTGVAHRSPVALFTNTVRPPTMVAATPAVNGHPWYGVFCDLPTSLARSMVTG